MPEKKSTYIPLGPTHRLQQRARAQLGMIEVQSGAHSGEDDIVRFKNLCER